MSRKRLYNPSSQSDEYIIGFNALSSDLDTPATDEYSIDKDQENLETIYGLIGDIKYMLNDNSSYYESKIDQLKKELAELEYEEKIDQKS